MKSQLRICLFTLALLFLSTVGLRAGGRPITLSDGSLCACDEEQAFPDTLDPEHKRPFKLAKVFLEELTGNASGDQKACKALEPGCANCQEIKEQVRSVVVQFRDGNAMRNLTLDFDGGNVRVNTVDLTWHDWQPHAIGNDRRKVKRDGPNTKIQWIFVNGTPHDCRTRFCRITFQDDNSAQAQ